MDDRLRLVEMFRHLERHSRAVSPKHWPIPDEVFCTGDAASQSIEGQYSDGSRQGTVRESVHALSRFVEIATVPRKEAAEFAVTFAEEFGQLGLEEGWHRGGPPWLVPGWHPESPFTGALEEPVASYLAYAQLALAAVRFAQCARDRRVPSPDDVAVVRSFLEAHHALEQQRGADKRRGVARPVGRGERHLPTDLAPLLGRIDWRGEPLIAQGRHLCRLLVTSIVNWWVADAQPILTWEESPVREQSAGLWGLLGHQLMLAVEQEIAPRCTDCERKFISNRQADRRRLRADHPLRRSRMPRNGSDGLCRDCKRKRARIRKDRYYEKHGVKLA